MSLLKAITSGLGVDEKALMWARVVKILQLNHNKS